MKYLFPLIFFLVVLVLIVFYYNSTCNHHFDRDDKKSKPKIDFKSHCSQDGKKQYVTDQTY